jgi:hypothetical protein
MMSRRRQENENIIKKKTQPILEKEPLLNSFIYTDSTYFFKKEEKH